MKRILILVIVFIAVICASPKEVYAAQMDGYGTDKLYEYLDEDTAEQMAGVEEAAESGKNIFSLLADEFRLRAESFLKPIRYLGVVLTLAVVSSFLSSYDLCGEVPQLAAVLASAVFIVPGLTELIELLTYVCKAVSVFLMGAVPVYAGLLMAGGAASAGSSYGTVTLLLANAVSVMADKAFVPAMSVLLGISLAGPFSAINLNGIIDSIYKPLKWLLTFSVTLFSGLISLQTFFTSRIDAAGLKTTKYVVSSAIPVVGSALGDGIEALRQSLALLRSGAGAFGVVAELLIFAPVFVSGIGWYISMSAAVVICDVFETVKLKSFTSSCLLVVKMILAVAVSVFVVSVVTAAVVLSVGN